MNALHTYLIKEPLEMLRKIAFASQSGKRIDRASWQAMCQPDVLQVLHIQTRKAAQGEQFAKIVASPYPSYGFLLLQKSGLMQHWINLAVAGTAYEGQMTPWSMDQNSPYHDLTLEGHTLQVLKNAVKLHVNAPLEKQKVLRLTAICHDLGKMYRPIQKFKETGFTSYPGHESHSAVLAELLLNYLEIGEYIPAVKPLVKNHMRPHSLVEGASAKAVRKLLRDLAEDGADWQDLCLQAEADGTAKNKRRGPDDLEYVTQLNALRDKIRAHTT